MLHLSCRSGSRARGLTFVGWLGVIALGAGGCGSSGTQAGSAAGGGAMTTAVDRSRCDDRGKQVVGADINNDKRPDVLKIYKTVGTGDNATQRLVCKQVDMNNDAKIDIVYHYDDGGALAFEEFDLDFDARFDMRAFYQGGRKVREELDTNYDNRVDFTKYYEADRLVRLERDANNDGRVDEWQYYEGGKLDRIGYDSTGGGRVDRWERAPEAETPAEAAPAPGAPPAGRAQVPSGATPAGGAPAAAGTAPAAAPGTTPAAPPAAAPAGNATP